MNPVTYNICIYSRLLVATTSTASLLRRKFSDATRCEIIVLIATWLSTYTYTDLLYVGFYVVGYLSRFSDRKHCPLEDIAIFRKLEVLLEIQL